MSTDRFLLWDFDGTLAFRPGHWTGVVCDVVAVERPAVGLTPARLRPHLKSGFPGHAPDVVRQPCPADQWWRALLPALARAVPSAAGLDAPDARRLVTGVRAAYTDAQGWQLFDDGLPARACLRDRGGRHSVLSHHAPELP
jgi:putative hydrolase of the HAD superfamily